MPKVSLFDTLPEEVKEALFTRAKEAGFGNILGLTDWLNSLGYEIRKSAVGERVKAMRQEYDELTYEMRAMSELARQIVTDDPDQQAALNDLGARMVTDQLIRAARALHQADLPIEERIPLLNKLAQPLTQSQRAAVYSRRWSQEQRQEAEAAARAEAAERATAVATRSGLSGETVDAIRREILGLD